MSQLEFTERQTGVTVFGKMQYRAVDIDVKPGITEIHFLPFKKAYYPSEYRLCNVDKTFPDVETIYIAVGVACVDIPNKMFPNVKRVISDNKNYETSNVLINKTDKTLLNTFYKKPGELIDLNILVIRRFMDARRRISLMLMRFKISIEILLKIILGLIVCQL